MKAVDFKTSNYFGGSVIFFGVIMTVLGLMLLFIASWIGLIPLFVSLIIFTTHYRVSVDFTNKICKEYVWFLALQTGADETKFESIEYIYITKGMTTQNMSSRGHSTTIRKEAYNAYLKFSEQSKIHLLSEDFKIDLTKKLNDIAPKLETKIVDRS